MTCLQDRHGSNCANWLQATAAVHGWPQKVLCFPDIRKPRTKVGLKGNLRAENIEAYSVFLRKWLSLVFLKGKWTCTYIITRTTPRPHCLSHSPFHTYSYVHSQAFGVLVIHTHSYKGRASVGSVNVSGSVSCTHFHTHSTSWAMIYTFLISA